MPRRVCLSIGVASVLPPANSQMRFGYLSGAIPAAKGIAEWALGSGFGEDNVRVVTDEHPHKVTRDTIQQAVDELFPDGAEPVEHMILSFCGHGLTDANLNSMSWLLSDSIRMKYRVLADAFYNELLLHGIERITLLADACREAPKDLDLMRLDAVRGVVVNGNKVDSPRLDRLASSQDGELGYMVSDPTSADPGKCIFSGVLTDVLWGAEENAIKNGKITTNEFAIFVRDRTAQRAKDYHLKLNPQCSVDPSEIVLFDSAFPPQGERSVQPWPSLSSATAMGANERSVVLNNIATEPLKTITADREFRSQVLGKKFGSSRPELSGGAEAARLPKSSAPLVEDLIVLRKMRSAPRWTNNVRKLPPEVKQRRIRQTVDQLEVLAAERARQDKGVRLRRSVGQMKMTGRIGPNLLVAGSKARIWSKNEVESGDHTAARMCFRTSAYTSGAPVVARLSDKGFAPVVPYAGLVTVLKVDESGELFQVYGQQGTQGAREAFHKSLDMIGEFAAGNLRGEQLDIAAGMLRAEKHVDPVMGVICAYLYRAAADLDSIRRMAYFYAAHGQPVPFDIALLGEMPVSRDEQGDPVLHIPQVAQRPDHGQSERPDYVTTATKAQDAAVGGRCPWLGLGWDYVGMARENAAMLTEDIAKYSARIPRNGFTRLPPAVGKALARKWGLKVQK